MERAQAIFILLSGIVAIAGSVLPFLFMTIRAIRKSFNQDDEISLPLTIFWIYIVQFFASIAVIGAFYIFDIFNKGGKYLLTESIVKFWDLSDSLLKTNGEKPEVLAIIAMCITYKSFFVFFNGIIPAIASLCGFIAGFYRPYTEAKKNGEAPFWAIIWGFVGGILAYILYFAYASIATESLFLSTPLHEMAREFWR